MVTSRGFREPVPVVRAAFALGFLLSLGAGSMLYFFVDDTDSAFAWTIAVPASAAFLGAFYLAAAVIAVASVRRPEWVRVRVGLPELVVFFWATLLATLLHLDKFHLGAGGTAARVAGWAWLIVYIVLPPLTTLGLIRQRMAGGSDSPRVALLPRAYRLALLLTGIALLAVGQVVFVAPGVGDDIWPWPVTSLTMRAMAAWMLALGTALLAIAWENDADRIVPGALGIVPGPALLAIGLARFPPDDWRAGAVYVVVLAAVASLGLLGLSFWRRWLSSTRAVPTPAAIPES